MKPSISVERVEPQAKSPSGARKYSSHDLFAYIYYMLYITLVSTMLAGGQIQNLGLT